jgi:hypothetical protein
MKVGITINGVIRDFITKFEMVYDKYFPSEEETEVEVVDRVIDSLNLMDHFKFNDIEDLNKFMYVDASLEIFGHAGETKLNSVEHLNKLHNLIEDMGHTPILISKELNSSKPATLFFLSKLSCKVNQIIFVKDEEKKWDYVDILVTADPKTLDTKPSDKISIKVINHYNKNCDSDYTIIDLKELIEDTQTLNKLFNTETVEFENL